MATRVGTGDRTVATVLKVAAAGAAFLLVVGLWGSGDGALAVATKEFLVGAALFAGLAVYAIVMFVPFDGRWLARVAAGKKADRAAQAVEERKPRPLDPEKPWLR